MEGQLVLVVLLELLGEGVVFLEAGQA